MNNLNNLNRKADPCYGTGEFHTKSGEGGKEAFARPLYVPPSSLVTKPWFYSGWRCTQLRLHSQSALQPGIGMYWHMSNNLSYTNFCGVNFPTMANLKPPSWGQLAHKSSWECINSHNQGWTSSSTWLAICPSLQVGQRASTCFFFSSSILSPSCL